MILLLICPATPVTLLATDDVASRTEDVNVWARVKNEFTFVGDVGAETFDVLVGVTNGFVPTSPSCPGVVDAGLVVPGRLGLRVAPSSCS